MFAVLIEEIVASWRDPRAAARRVIGRVDGWGDVGLLFGVAFCVSSIGAAAVALLFGDGSGAGLSSLVVSLFFSAAAYAILTFLIFRVGKLFGGTGAAMDLAAVIAWHSLATAPLAPVVALSAAATGPEGGAALLVAAQFVVAGAAIWLLALFVAEAHGFRSALRVGFALVGGAMTIGLVLSALLAGLLS